MIHRLRIRRTLELWLLGATIAFPLACGDGGEPSGPGSDPETGFVRVTSTTTGAHLDADGYAFSIDGQAGRNLGINDEVTVTGVALGGHQVHLSGQAGNCSLTGANPVSVFVRPADTAQAVFEVACEAPVSWDGKIALLANPDGWYSIYVLDGATFNLTLVDPFVVEVPVPYHAGPHFSPDGSRIAFQSFGDIWVVNAGGWGLRNLTDHGEVISSALSGGLLTSELSWSPDGTRIAYAAHGSPTMVCVINADGTGSETQVAEGVWRPDWSPDGSRLVFEMENGKIGVVNADGSGLETLAQPEGGGRHPRWSPDGARVVFQTGVGQIGSVDADGNNLRTLIDLDGRATRPQWSPDGSKIAFLRELPTCNSPCVLSIADGSGNLVEEVDDFKDSQGLDRVFPFGWSPDGSKLGFSVRWFVRDKLYIVNSDGTGLTPVTGDSYDHIFGSWTG